MDPREAALEAGLTEAQADRHSAVAQRSRDAMAAIAEGLDMPPELVLTDSVNHWSRHDEELREWIAPRAGLPWTEDPEDLVDDRFGPRPASETMDDA